MEFKVKWTDYARTAYTYGSQISFKNDHILFENAQMPPSFAITQWHSMTNFQGNRAQPELPILKKKQTYTLQLVAQTVPQDSVYLKITYFDRFGEEVSFDVLKNGFGRFEYPEEAFSYTIELINSGCEQLVFNYLLLNDFEDDFTEIWGSLPILYPSSLDKLNVILIEPNNLDFYNLIPEFLEELGDIMLLEYQNSEYFGYASYQFEEILKERLIEETDKSLSNITFIGYGPLSNFFSCFYASRFNAKANITTMIGERAFYQKLLYGLIGNVDSVIDSVFELREDSNRVFFYGDTDNLRGHSLIYGAIDYSDQLRL